MIGSGSLLDATGKGRPDDRARIEELANQARLSAASAAAHRARARTAVAGDPEQAAAAAEVAAELVLAQPLEAFIRPILLLTPQSECRGGRCRRVLELLRDEGLFVRRLEKVSPRTRTKRHLDDAWMGQLLRRAAGVIVLPRPDGTIGAGTLRDIRLARRHRLPVEVLTPGGDRVPFPELRFVQTTDDAGRQEGRFEFAATLGT